jgi:hypothetical protein
MAPRISQCEIRGRGNEGAIAEILLRTAAPRSTTHCVSGWGSWSPGPSRPGRCDPNQELSHFPYNLYVLKTKGRIFNISVLPGSSKKQYTLVLFLTKFRYHVFNLK